MGKSNVYIHNVSSSTWPGGKVGGSNYVVVTMSACVGDVFYRPSAWNLVTNPIGYWTQNKCNPATVSTIQLDSGLR